MFGLWVALGLTCWVILVDQAAQEGRPGERDVRPSGSIALWSSFRLPADRASRAAIIRLYMHKCVDSERRTARKCGPDYGCVFDPAISGSSCSGMASSPVHACCSIGTVVPPTSARGPMSRSVKRRQPAPDRRQDHGPLVEPTGTRSQSTRLQDGGISAPGRPGAGRLPGPVSVRHLRSNSAAKTAHH